MNVEQPKIPSIALKVVLFIGILSVFYAEVNSGSSPTWFANPWGLLIVFSLYLGHLLFYVNIAIRTKRVSLSQLYLLGCLVGLYEGPITKVLWHGYPGQTASWFFLGFAVTEFIMLVFFWHPIFSFMLPVIIFELLSLDYLKKHEIHSWLEQTMFFTRPCLSKFVLVAIAFIGATFLSVNAGFNLSIILFSGIVNFLLLMIFKRINLRSEELQGINSLYLAGRGFKMVIIYLILLYSITFFFLQPQYIPKTITLILTVLIYVFIFLIFLKSPRNSPAQSERFSELDYNKLVQYSWILWLLFLVIFPFIASAIAIEMFIMYLFLLTFGTIIFLSRIFWVFSRNLGENKSNITY